MKIPVWFLITAFSLIFLLIGMLIGGGYAVESVRGQMQDRGLVFCDPGNPPVGYDVTYYENMTIGDFGVDE